MKINFRSVEFCLTEVKKDKTCYICDFQYLWHSNRDYKGMYQFRIVKSEVKSEVNIKEKRGMWELFNICEQRIKKYIE